MYAENIFIFMLVESIFIIAWVSISNLVIYFIYNIFLLGME